MFIAGDVPGLASVCQALSGKARSVHVKCEATSTSTTFARSLARAYIDSTGSNGKRRTFGLQLMKVLYRPARGASFCSQACSGLYYSCIVDFQREACMDISCR